MANTTDWDKVQKFLLTVSILNIKNQRKDALTEKEEKQLVLLNAMINTFNAIMRVDEPDDITIDDVLKDDILTKSDDNIPITTTTTVIERNDSPDIYSQVGCVGTHGVIPTTYPITTTGNTHTSYNVTHNNNNNRGNRRRGVGNRNRVKEIEEVFSDDDTNDTDEYHIMVQTSILEASKKAEYFKKQQWVKIIDDDDTDESESESTSESTSESESDIESYDSNSSNNDSTDNDNTTIYHTSGSDSDSKSESDEKSNLNTDHDIQCNVLNNYGNTLVCNDQLVKIC
jgi:hypothetical protein